MAKNHDASPFLFPSTFQSPSDPSESTPPSSPSSPPTPSFFSSQSNSSFNSPFKTSLSLPRPPLSHSSSSNFPPAAFAPCAACKFHNRRCSEQCYLASFFPPNDVHRFSVVDSVFGSSNVVSFLQQNSSSSYIPLLLLLRDTSREDGEVHSDSKNNTEINIHKQQRDESMNSNHVRELIQGRELAKQLKVHLSSESSDIIREDLVQRILSSFEKSLSILNWSESINKLQNDAAPTVTATNDPTKSPIYMYGTPGSLNFDAVHSHAAKKRCYFTCSYAFTQNCWATKEVQRSDEDPNIFEVTYQEIHTCSLPMLPVEQEEKQNNISSNVEEQQSEGFLLGFQNSVQQKSEELLFAFQNTTNASAAYFPTVEDTLPSWIKYGEKDIIGVKYPRANVEESHAMKGILNFYENLSRQAVNLQNSGIMFSTNVSIGLQEDIREILGVSTLVNTSKYLGLPSLIGWRKRSAFSFFVIDFHKGCLIGMANFFPKKAGKCFVKLLAKLSNPIPRTSSCSQSSFVICCRK
ncbi:uncharacterized protein [Euphorbia lathyris]|uniref:uncharacterized protein isoform X2 n=1 Tax=Euphorbia lathyris TaxID=212925 RepID=UPI0033131E41